MALAEARFLSKQHEWKFDSAWQEMLNNAILKVINIMSIQYFIEYYVLNVFLPLTITFTNFNFDVL